ncbi:hypothetical protein MVEN_00864300 [Mycena venus]|uniref:Mid2 domain-containing protein n=1 Tax=Mycena venus TaxID=2733690 RepID=A0A8H6YHN4_9AGAR|nr:hypothetical protein MVEN_00864300 [Mycena venus]
MLLLATILVTVGRALGVVILPVAGPFQSGGTVPLVWTSNVSSDPPRFILELYSPTFNSRDVLAKNVDMYSDKMTAQLPDLPPSNDYIFWFVDPADSNHVFMNSNTFRITAADTTTSSPTSSPTTSLPPPPPPPPPPTSPATTTTTHVNTTPAPPPTSPPASPTSHSSATLSPPTSQSSASSKSATSSTTSGAIGPTSALPASASSSSSSSAVQPPQTQFADSTIQTTSKSMSTGTIVGLAIGVILVLISALALFLFLHVRRARSRRHARESLLAPQVYAPALHSDDPPLRHSETSLASEKPPPLVPQRRAALAQLREMQQQLAVNTSADAMAQRDGDLEAARRENEALRARIQALERDLQSHADTESAYESPPGYY